MLLLAISGHRVTLPFSVLFRLHVRAFDIYTDQSATTQYKVRVLRATPPMIDVFCTASDRMVEMGEDARKQPMLVRPRCVFVLESRDLLLDAAFFHDHKLLTLKQYMPKIDVLTLRLVRSDLDCFRIDSR